MLRVRVLADIPPAEQPKLEVMDTRGQAFAALAARLKQAKGPAFSVCDLEIPTRGK